MKRTSLLLLLAIVVFIELFLILFSLENTYSRNPYTVITADHLASAQVARNLASGEGYRADSLTLYEVALYDKKGWLSDGPPWRNTYRFPLPILIMAALFKIFGANSFTANFLYPSIFHFLTVTTLFALTYLLFKNAVVAFMASIIFITNNGLLYAMLNKSEGADVFFFTLSLLVFFVWDHRRKNYLLFILGLVLGVSFLNRFNEGFILLFIYLILFYVRGTLKIKHLIYYLAGFIIPLIPFVLHNLMALGTPFFSSNSYFQLIDNSIVSKYMNPWYKLNYAIDVAKPFTYPLSYPADFLNRALKYISKYSLNEFVRFSGSIWWWVPVTYVTLKRPVTARIKELMMILLLALALHILLVAPFGLHIGYLRFLFVPVIIIVAKTVYEWNVAVSEFSPDFVSQPRSPAVNRRLIQLSFLVLTVFVVLLSLYARVSLKTYVFIIFLTIVLVLVGITKKHIGTILVYSSLILLISSVLWVSSRYKQLDIRALTTEDPSVLKKIEDTTSPNDIILSTHPWNPAWFSKRPALAIPEYPDEIYLLMKKYRLNIKAIYFSHVDEFLKYLHHRTPISYHSYARIANNNLAIKGFTRVEPLVAGGLLLHRDNDPLLDILNTKDIDVGDIASSSHLTYGFSLPMTVDGSKVCWVLRDSGNFDTQKFSFFKNGQLVEYDTPNAEITFLWEGIKAIRRIEISVVNFGPKETITVVLNSNLFSYGDKGFFVGTVPLRKGWNVIDLPLEKNSLRQGLNKLDFWFKDQRPLSAFYPLDVPPRDEPTKVSYQRFLTIAFDKVHFAYDDEHLFRQSGRKSP